MSDDKRIIPNSGGVTVQKVNNFKFFKHKFFNQMYRNLNYLGDNYPGDYSFNVFIAENLRRNSAYSIIDFEYYLRSGGAVPSIVPIRQGEAGTGTIDNPKGGKVLKVAYFDELKTVWEKYDHDKSLTDFELNEFLIIFLRKVPNLNLDTYLKSELKMWKIFKLRFPKAVKKDFRVNI